jgi:hypothetical protein
MTSDEQRGVTVSDFLDEKRQEIADRLKELEPVVDEVRRLEAAAVALADAVGSMVGTAASEAGAAASAAVTRRRGPGRPRGSGTGKKGPGRPKGRGGRPKGSGTRSKQALRLVRKQPGITIAELAAEMKISSNYLYRVLPGLEQEGKLEKKGRGWFPKAA